MYAVDSHAGALWDGKKSIYKIMFKLTQKTISENGYFTLLNNIFVKTLNRNYSLTPRKDKVLLQSSKQPLDAIKVSILDLYSVNLSRSLYESTVLLKKDSKTYKGYGSSSLDTDDEYQYDKEILEDEDTKEEKGSKIIKTKVNSLRTDVLLKAGLGVARK